MDLMQSSQTKRHKYNVQRCQWNSFLALIIQKSTITCMRTHGAKNNLSDGKKTIVMKLEIQN